MKQTHFWHEKKSEAPIQTATIWLETGLELMFAVSKQTYCTNLLCRSGTNLEIWRSTFQQNMKTSAFLRRCWFFFFYNKCLLFRHVTVTVLLNDIEVAKQSPDNHSPVQSLSPRLRAFWAAAPRQHGPTLLHYSRTQRHFLSHTIQLHHDDSHFFCFHCSYNRLLPRLLSLCSYYVRLTHLRIIFSTPFL